MRFQTKDFVLRVNKNNITGQNTINQGKCEFGGKHGSVKDKQILFRVFFEIYDHGFNT